MKNKKSTKAVAPAAKRFKKGKRVEGFKTYKRDGEPTHVMTGNKFVAQCRYLTAVGEEPVEVLNKIVDATRGKKSTQVVLYRVHPHTRVNGNKIICPNGHQPRLVGLTSSNVAFQRNEVTNQKETSMKNKTAKAEKKAVKKTAVKKTSDKPGQGNLIFGLSARAVIRALGAANWKAEQAIAAIRAKLPSVAPSVIQRHLKYGKTKSDRFDIAELSKDQFATLKKLAASAS
jgi:hypothetical protein